MLGTRWPWRFRRAHGNFRLSPSISLGKDNLGLLLLTEGSTIRACMNVERLEHGFAARMSVSVLFQRLVDFDTPLQNLGHRLGKIDAALLRFPGEVRPHTPLDRHPHPHLGTKRNSEMW